MASGDYVVGRDIDFQYSETRGDGNAASLVGRPPREVGGLKKRTRARPKKKTGGDMDGGVEHASLAPGHSVAPPVGSAKRFQKSAECEGSRPLPVGAKSKASRTKKSQIGSSSGPGSPQSGETVQNSDTHAFRPSSSATIHNDSPVGKRSSRPAKTPQSPNSSQSKVGAGKQASLKGSKSHKKKGESSALPSPSVAQSTRKHAVDRTSIHKRVEPAADANIWYTSSVEERGRILDFWKELSVEKRAELVKLDKNALFGLIHQERRNCTCSVCGSKREAVDEELDELYDLNEDRLASYATSLQSKPAVFIGPEMALDVQAYFTKLIGSEAENIDWDEPQFHAIFQGMKPLKASSPELDLATDPPVPALGSASSSVFADRRQEAFDARLEEPQRSQPEPQSTPEPDEYQHQHQHQHKHSRDVIHEESRSDDLLSEQQDQEERATPNPSTLNEQHFGAVQENLSRDFVEHSAAPALPLPQQQQQQQEQQQPQQQQPLAYLSTIMNVLLEGSKPLSLDQNRYTSSSIEGKIFAQLAAINQLGDKLGDAGNRVGINKQILAIWNEMLSLYKVCTPSLNTLGEAVDTTLTKSGDASKSLDADSIRKLAESFAKPILECNEDQVPANTMRMLMSLGPICDQQGIGLSDQRRVFIQILSSELVTRYPEVVHDFFTDFAQDVEENNGQNLLKMLEELSGSDPEKPPVNRTQAEMAKYYLQVQGEAPPSSPEFDLDVHVDAPFDEYNPAFDDYDDVAEADEDDEEEEEEEEDALTSNSSSASMQGRDLYPLDENSGNDEVNKEDDRSEYTEDRADLIRGRDLLNANAGIDATFDDARLDYDYAYSDEGEEDDYEDDEFSDDISQLEREESKRITMGSWYLHYLLARLLEQRILKAYREHVARKRQQSLLAELAEEDARAEADTQRKLKEKDKKKSKKLALKQQREEEANRKALEAKKKAEKAEAARQKEAARRAQQLEQDRLKQEAHRRKIEERMAQLALESSSQKAAAASKVDPPATTAESGHASPKHSPATSASKTKLKPKVTEKPKAESAKSDKGKSSGDKAKPEEKGALKQTKGGDLAKAGGDAKASHDAKRSPKVELGPKQGAASKTNSKTAGGKPPPSKPGTFRADTSVPFSPSLNTPAFNPGDQPPVAFGSGQVSGMNKVFSAASGPSTSLGHPVGPSVGPSMGPSGGSPLGPSVGSPLAHNQGVGPGLRSFSLPPGMTRVGPVMSSSTAPSASGMLSDISGLPTNLGASSNMGLSAAASSGLAINPNNMPPSLNAGHSSPAVGSIPLSSNMNMPMGNNLMNSNMTLAGLAPGYGPSPMAHGGGVGPGGNPGAPTMLGGLENPYNGQMSGANGFGGRSGNLPTASGGLPLNKGGALSGRAGNFGVGMGMYHVPQQQGQQPQQHPAHMAQAPASQPMPQYSSVSSLWSPNAGVPSNGKNGWPRSTWMEDIHRTPDNISAPGASLWSAPAGANSKQRASLPDILKAVKLGYADVRSNGVDGYVPSQLLYHAAQAKSEQRFNQSELYKACSLSPTFECMRDDVGLITHIRM